MREMTMASEYRYVPSSTLAILAQRLGSVFVAPPRCQRSCRLS